MPGRFTAFPEHRDRRATPIAVFLRAARWPARGEARRDFLRAGFQHAGGGSLRMMPPWHIVERDFHAISANYLLAGLR